MEHVRFPVEGMTCTACVGHVTKAMRTLAGVEKVRVDLATDSARVAFDPSRTSLVAIASAIQKAGYQPRLSAAEPWSAPQRSGFLRRLGLRR